MKLDAQTTALGLLSSKRIQLAEGFIKMPTTFDIETEFKSMLPLIRQRIQYLSNPFLNAYLIIQEKILKVLMYEPVKQSGTFILPQVDNITLTVFYDLATNCGERKLMVNGRLLVIAKNKHQPYPSLLFHSHITDNYGTTFQRLKEMDQVCKINDEFNMVLGLILFTKYCDVETKLIPAGKETTHRLQRYVNHTKVPIEILDATWFTTLVRSGAFTVGQDTGGFFRWHAVGPNKSERKLIWINPYEKKGYTRKAKVLLHRPDSLE